jgi:hypothetical protein
MMDRPYRRSWPKNVTARLSASRVIALVIAKIAKKPTVMAREEATGVERLGFNRGNKIQDKNIAPQAPA